MAFVNLRDVHRRAVELHHFEGLYPRPQSLSMDVEQPLI